ncbi:MAG: hypothetical protein IKU54_03885 [Oscillospiraceae bacterium]|nr:hypothetical protein [Oscillospiraceae bacterium]
MNDFITGLLLGGAFTFFITEYHRWKSFIISGGNHGEKNGENVQLQNIMNYDGSERGQKTDEN